MWIPTVEASNLFSLAAASLLAAVHSAGSRDRFDAELCDAASSGNVSRVKALLADGVSADSADEDGTTALMAAAFAGEREIVELMLQAEADPNLQDEAGLTALMNAVIGDGEMNLEGAHSVFYDIIECLLEAGADVMLEDENDFTASDYAASYELDEIREPVPSR
ncbi:MAG: ankyrin repeat domain-containing protein [Acidobacteriota bacterium]